MTMKFRKLLILMLGIAWLLPAAAQDSENIGTLVKITPKKGHDDELIELHIRHVAGGAFTDFLFEGMAEKTILRIEAPLGSYFLREESERPIIFSALLPRITLITSPEVNPLPDSLSGRISILICC